MPDPVKLLSLDLGTLKTGAVLWHGDQPQRWWLLEQDAMTPALTRVQRISEVLRQIAEQNEVRAIALEKIIHVPGRPNEALKVLRNDIAARRTGWAPRLKIPVTELHPSTVKASVRPRAFKRPRTEEDAKAATLLGVEWLYGGWTKELDDNVIDAVAVGHCYLGRNKEAKVLT